MILLRPFKHEMFEVYGSTLAYLIIAAYVLRNTIWYWAMFLLGGMSSFIVVIYFVSIQEGGRQSSPYRGRRFKFLNELAKTIGAEDVGKSQATGKETLPNTLISSTLDELISLIIKSFFTSWFQRISATSVVQDDIREELQHVIRNINDRVRQIDLLRLIITKLLPILHDHFNAYIKVTSRSENINAEHIAKHYNKGKIHHGVTISNSEPNFNEKKYLRSKVSKLLPMLLSSNEKQSEVSISLVTEILACTILTNIFQLAGEADFYNVLITKLIGDNLKHRGQVKQLIAALEQHTRHKVNLQPFTITDQTESKIMRRLIPIIRRQELDDLKQIEKYILVQMRTPSSPSVTKKLHILKETINEQQIQISLREKSAVEALSLLDILNNASTLKLFTEFLDSRQRVEYIEFWLAVDRLRAPLEENEDDDLNLLLEFSNVEDITEIFTQFCSLNILQLDSLATELIAVLAYKTYSAREKPMVYQKARKALFRLQRDIFLHMTESDFPDFKKSEIFSKFVNLDLLTAKKAMFVQQDVSPEVLKAVESAFNEIMQSADHEGFLQEDDKEAFLDSDSFSGLSDKEVRLKKNLFGESLLLFGPRQSKLFDDSDDSSENESLNDSLLLANSEEDISDTLVDSQLFMAAPGNLSLAEEIKKLNKEIDKLNEQLQILDPLIRKAELTNNITELKILKKSRLNLDREITTKNLQNQQYIVQENDNSLFGKSRVSIQSYISGNEGGREFMLYIVEVQKLAAGDVVSAGWIVARRFSQFFQLHEYLRAKYPLQVGQLPFPKRTTMSVLKFQQRQLVELRKAALEEYLQQLIGIPEVCHNKAFRSFLSSENFNLRKNQPFEEKLGVVIKPRNNIEMVANKLYNGISNTWGSVPESKVDLDNLKDMQQELKQFDEMAPARVLFVKPICDLLISVFGLTGSKSWLRGRALIVILQQVFGTTIEKKIGEQIEIHLTLQEALFKMINGLKEILFPNGKFKDPPVVRTVSEQASTRQEAKLLLEMFMDETCSKVFGHSNTRYATERFFGMIQNEYLNKHLLFEMMDEILEEIVTL